MNAGNPLEGDPALDPDASLGERELARLEGRSVEELRDELLTVRAHYRESEARHARTLERLRAAEAEAAEATLRLELHRKRTRASAIAAFDRAVESQRGFELDAPIPCTRADFVRALTDDADPPSIGIEAGSE